MRSAALRVTRYVLEGQSNGKESRPHHNLPGLHRVQEPQLYQLEEQAQRPDAVGVQQVLPALPSTPRSPRDEISSGC